MSLPVGYTCPEAGACKTYVKPGPLGPGEKGSKKIRPKPGEEHLTCFAAGTETSRPEYQRMVWNNYKLLTAARRDPNSSYMKLISDSIRYYESQEGKIRILRIHSGGDFFQQDYFDAWLNVAISMPDIIFYAYTTSLQMWVKRIGQIPPNFKLTASRESRQAHLIEEEALRQSIIVRTVQEAMEKALPINIDEFEAIFTDGDFALLLHGGQVAGETAELENSSGEKVTVSLTTLARVNEKIIKYFGRKYKLNPIILNNFVQNIKNFLIICIVT